MPFPPFPSIDDNPFSFFPSFWPNNIHPKTSKILLTKTFLVVNSPNGSFPPFYNLFVFFFLYSFLFSHKISRFGIISKHRWMNDSPHTQRMGHLEDRARGNCGWMGEQLDGKRGKEGSNWKRRDTVFNWAQLNSLQNWNESLIICGRGGNSCATKF